MHRASSSFSRRPARALLVAASYLAFVLGLVLGLASSGAAQGFLDPTPDADSADPYIVAKAAELGSDAQQIFAFVGDEIGYESYPGSLRGARQLPSRPPPPSRSMRSSATSRARRRARRRSRRSGESR